MESLTSSDVQRLLAAIAELHSLHDFDSFGEKALAIVHRLVGSEFPVFHTTHVQSRSVANTVLSGYPDPSVIEEVSRRHVAEHPIVARLPSTLNGAYKLSDFITLAELHQLEGLYDQFLRLIDCTDQMVMFFPTCEPQNWNQLVQENSTLVGIALNRSRPNFSDRDRLLLNLLRPHLFQAYTNAQTYQHQQRLIELYQSIDSLGLMIVSRSGQVQFITAQAIHYLQCYFAEPVNLHQLPEHLEGWIRYQIALTQQANPLQANVPLRLEQAEKQLVIRFICEAHLDRYLLLLEEQTLSLLDSLKLLGLSPRETEVLYWMIQGKDNQAIAKRLQINSSTVRKHLERIFHKLGVQSRTEAIAQALYQLGILTR